MFFKFDELLKRPVFDEELYRAYIERRKRKRELRRILDGIKYPGPVVDNNPIEDPSTNDPSKV